MTQCSALLAKKSNVHGCGRQQKAAAITKKQTCISKAITERFHSLCLVFLCSYLTCRNTSQTRSAIRRQVLGMFHEKKNGRARRGPLQKAAAPRDGRLARQGKLLAPLEVKSDPYFHGGRPPTTCASGYHARLEP